MMMSTNGHPPVTTATEVDAPTEVADLAQPGDTGYIVVRLPDERENDIFGDLAELARARGLTELAEVLDGPEVLSAGRLVTVTTPGQLRELEQSGSDSPFRQLESLTQYWRIDLRDRVDAMAAVAARPADLVERLRALPYVESAYAEPRMVVPVMTGDKDEEPPPATTTRAAPLSAAVNTQGYLDPAPTGVDAREAWTRSGGDGTGIGIVDLELGWQLDHVEFANLTVIRIVGDEDPTGVGHGTAALGVLVARHDGTGIDGVVQTPRFVGVASHYRAATKTNLHVANAVVAAMQALQAGDVMLIEVQTVGGEPIEVDPAAATAVRLACRLDRIVLIAGGNAGRRLDTMPDRDGALPFSPKTAACFDTGSIVVGAGRSAVVAGGHERRTDSNFGSRVDCFAWGTLVATSGWIGTLPTGVLAQQQYTQTFAGTSSASAIVAGAAVLIQSMHLADKGKVLTPAELRGLLRDPNLGTPQVNGLLGERIGSMPDLRKIADRIAPPVPPAAPIP